MAASVQRWRRFHANQGEVMKEEIGKACYECRYYDMWDGICVNPLSDRMGESVVGLGACDEIVEEDE